MGDWHLIPWTLQYLVSGISIIIISAVIFSKNRESLAYQSFFAYGFCTAIWELMAFLHRNAATAELSKFFFRIDLFFVSMTFVFLPLTILWIWRESKVYFWLVFPALIIGMYALLEAPFEIFSSNFGWSFKLKSEFGKMFYSISILYMLLFCGVFIHLARSIFSKTLAKKYIFVLIGYLLVYGIGILISTLFLQRYPDFPPLGGILTLVQFLFIAYAVSLKPEEIIPYTELKEPINELSQSYIAFLNRFQAAIPGRELGESSYRFQDYIDAAGLENIVVSKSRALVFKADKLNEVDIREAPDSILRLMKEHTWAAETTRDLVPILLKTYELLQSQSETRANEWLRQILREHGGFLAKHDVLKSLPEKVYLPVILQRLKPGQTYLFKEDTPKNAYRMLMGTEPYGIESLCITKLSPHRIRRRYGIRKASILWVTFENAEATITPKNLARLTRTVAEFSMKPNGTIVLLDCFDQIRLANGFQSSLGLLKDLRALSRNNNSILFTSIPPKLFEKEELETIERELEGAVLQ
jgi:hypothetical protein